MKINIEVTHEEIVKMLQAITSGKERKALNFNLDGEKLARIIHDPNSVLNEERHSSSEQN